MYSDTGDTTSLVPGFPIRTSSDPRSVDSSPRHIAASHVLHRLSMPRHPPCALKHLQTQKPKLFQNCTKEHATHTGQRIPLMLATTIHKSNTTPHHQDGATTPVNKPRVLSQGPIVCRQPCSSPKKTFAVVHPARAHYRRRAPHGSHPTRCGVFFVVLLRKEVIQPHLPVRLPCYDFVPIADPTFDSSPHKG